MISILQGMVTKYFADKDHLTWCVAGSSAILFSEFLISTYALVSLNGSLLTHQNQLEPVAKTIL